MSTVASVHEIAAELLTKCEAALGTTIGGVPPVVALNPGLPALDRQCDQLYVWESPPVVESAGGASIKYAWRTFIGLSAQIARCVPTGSVENGRYSGPTPAESTSAAEKVMEDMWALWNGVASEFVANDIWEGYPCREMRFVSMDSLDPQGGFAGWTLNLQVELDGYEVVL